LLVRNVPKNYSEKELKKHIVEEFAKMNKKDDWEGELKKEFKRRRITDVEEKKVMR
jgi:hypothetical protein